MPQADFGLCCAMNEFGQKLMCLFYFVTYNVYRESIAVVKKINVEFSTKYFFSVVLKISGSNIKNLSLWVPKFSAKAN